MKKLLLTLAAFACFFTTYSQDALLVYRQNYAKPLLVALDDITNITYEDADQIISLEKWNIMSESETTVVDSIVFVNSDTISSTQCAYLVCPDEHHPHMIDLGLPSGILWSCCNVGASAPEEYGGYYAWGETETKSVYAPETYQYYLGRDSVSPYPIYEYIGDDIAGTEYDVAYKKCGVTWRMPSKEQIEELQDNCISDRFGLNNVRGALIFGTNGAKLFFPRSGFYSNSTQYAVDLMGVFWSSSHRQDHSRQAFYILVQELGALGIGSTAEQCEGMPVRPVSK